MNHAVVSCAMPISAVLVRHLLKGEPKPESFPSFPPSGSSRAPLHDMSSYFVYFRSQVAEDGHSRHLQTFAVALTQKRRHTRKKEKERKKEDPSSQQRFLPPLVRHFPTRTPI